MNAPAVNTPDLSTRRLLSMMKRNGGLLSFSYADRLGPGPSRALSTALRAGWVERTSSGYALNTAGRAVLDAKQPAKQAAT